MNVRRFPVLVGLMAVAALVVTLLGVPTGPGGVSFGTAAQAAAGSTLASAELPAAPADKKKGKNKGKNKNWKPTAGVVFNNPLGAPKVRYRVLDQVQDAIKRAPKNSEIRVMSWNIMSRSAVTHLLNAQRRGVRIRALMDNSNLREIPNPQFVRLRNELARHNKGLKPAKRSYAKTCERSCRGARGQAHGKFYLFSRTGAARAVTMHGSTNLTTAAATNQWNDLYTTVGNVGMYNFFTKVFEQMWQDKPRKNPFVEYRTKTDHVYFSPLYGKNYRYDPYQALLNNIKCRGAQGGAGNARGRTIIRVAPDVMRNERGMRAARSLRKLWNNGCDVRIGYTVMGYDIHRYLRASGGRGPVPMRHLVQDFDGDRDFDNYFHLKAMSVNGVVGKDRSAYVVANGSSNLSGAASASDENIGIYKRKALTLRYQRFIDQWFNNFPSHARPTTTYRGKIDLYRHVDMD